MIDKRESIFELFPIANIRDNYLEYENQMKTYFYKILSFSLRKLSLNLLPNIAYLVSLLSPWNILRIDPNDSQDTPSSRGYLI